MSTQPLSSRQILGMLPSKPNPQDSVLLINEAQNEYDCGKLAIPDIESSRAVIGNLLKQWRNANGYIVHVIQEAPENAPIFTPGTKLADEFQELKPEGEIEKVISKSASSSFTATDLDAYLKEVNKTKVVLVGYMVGPALPTDAAPD